MGVSVGDYPRRLIGRFGITWRLIERVEILMILVGQNEERRNSWRSEIL
jgi:hypothetical protein